MISSAVGSGGIGRFADSGECIGSPSKPSASSPHSVSVQLTKVPVYCGFLPSITLSVQLPTGFSPLFSKVHKYMPMNHLMKYICLRSFLPVFYGHKRPIAKTARTRIKLAWCSQLTDDIIRALQQRFKIAASAMLNIYSCSNMF